MSSQIIGWEIWILIYPIANHGIYKVANLILNGKWNMPSWLCFNFPTIVNTIFSISLPRSSLIQTWLLHIYGPYLVRVPSSNARSPFRHRPFNTSKDMIWCIRDVAPLVKRHMNNVVLDLIILKKLMVECN